MKPGLAAVAWAALATAIALPVLLAAMSPQLAWRQPIYIAAGFAGVLALGLMLLQPLLIGGLLPGLSVLKARSLHRIAGGLLVGAVVVHVGALWITSPPDVIDALLLDSPTPFSIWGVMAMWGIFAVALLAVLRRPLRLHPRTWRIGHTALAAIIVGGSIAHALLIDGTMETFSKIGLCLLLLAATVKVLADFWAWVVRSRSR